jgi:hypothetical protein
VSTISYGILTPGSIYSETYLTQTLSKPDRVNQTDFTAPFWFTQGSIDGSVKSVWFTQGSVDGTVKSVWFTQGSVDEVVKSVWFTQGSVDGTV